MKKALIVTAIIVSALLIMSFLVFNIGKRDARTARASKTTSSLYRSERSSAVGGIFLLSMMINARAQ